MLQGPAPQMLTLNHSTSPTPHVRIRGNGEVIRREEFEQRKAAAEAVRQARLNRRPKKLASQGKDLGGCPLLQVGLGYVCLGCRH